MKEEVDRGVAVESDASSPAVRQAIAILEGIAAVPDGLTLTEVSERLGLPKNAVFRITRTLQAAGYVDRDAETLRFRPTTKFLVLGQPRGRESTLAESAVPAMRRLRDACKETVQLGVRSGDGGVIVEVVDGLHPLRIAVDLGLRFPFYNNAPGKCLLAHLPHAERAETIDRLDLVPCTSRTIVDRGALREECERIVSRGWSTDLAEADEGIHCVAAPIFGRHRQALAVVWVSGPSRRLSKDLFPTTGKLVAFAAAEITERLSR